MPRTTAGHSVGATTAAKSRDPRNNEAWAKILNFCQKALFNYFHRQLGDSNKAEELAQDVICTLANEAEKWHPAKGQAWLLSSADILGPGALLKRLTSGECALAKQVWAGFGKTSQRALAGISQAEAADRKPRESLAGELNKLIAGPLFWREEFRADGAISLTEETERLLGEQPTPSGVRLMRLNRLLLEDAFRPLLAPVSFRKWLWRKAAGRLQNYVNHRKTEPPMVSLDAAPVLEHGLEPPEGVEMLDDEIELSISLFDREFAVDLFREAWEAVSTSGPVEKGTLRALVLDHPVDETRAEIAARCGLTKDALDKQISRLTHELNLQVGRLVAERRSQVEVAAEVEELRGIVERAAARAREYQRFLDLAWRSLRKEYEQLHRLSVLQTLEPLIKFCSEDTKTAAKELDHSLASVKAEVQAAQERWFDLFAKRVLKEGFAATEARRDKDFHRLFRMFKNREALDKAWKRLLAEASPEDRCLLEGLESVVKHPSNLAVTEAGARLGISVLEVEEKADRERTRFFEYVVAGLLQTADARAESRAKLKAIVLEARQYHANVQPPGEDAKE